MTDLIAAARALLDARPAVVLKYEQGLMDMVATLANALEVERKRAEKAETERDEWKDEYQTATRGRDLYKEASVNRQIERDQARARLAVAYVAADAWLDKQYGIAPCVNDLTPIDAQAALDKLLAEARLEGWWAGREAAAQVVEDECTKRSQYALAQSCKDAIRALPEPKEASHG